jgi:glycosyltransferase involved in cell wall biosynthesis
MTEFDGTTGVMHVIDTLAAGGLERVAVNLANLMPRDRYRMHLCTTRAEGPLAGLLSTDVGRLSLIRRHTLDVRALQQMRQYLRDHRIQILHAHGSAIFLAGVAAMRPPYPRLVWHDHYGRHATQPRPAWLYRLLVRPVDHIFAVNQPLADWAVTRLRVPPDRVAYLPNFVCAPDETTPAEGLPGTRRRRVVCVANFRPQKDHLTLLAAIAEVRRHIPDVHLLLVGCVVDEAYTACVHRRIAELELTSHVSLLGERTDVPQILQACGVGVLSSESEGLPLSLLEYGMAGLAVVATHVGQCGEVLDEGTCGLLVRPGAPDELARALRRVLTDEELRAGLAAWFRERVHAIYSPGATIRLIDRTYQQVLGGTHGPTATDERSSERQPDRAEVPAEMLA